MLTATQMTRVTVGDVISEHPAPDMWPAPSSSLLLVIVAAPAWSAKFHETAFWTIREDASVLDVMVAFAAMS